jgi:hypothetical protein
MEGVPVSTYSSKHLTYNENNLLFEYSLAEQNYRNRVCSKCGLKQRKKRNCGILQGNKRTSCMWMEKAIHNRKKYKEVSKEVFKELGDGLESIKQSLARGEADVE